MTNYASTYLQDIVDAYPGGTSEAPVVGGDDSASVCVWIDGAWYNIRVALCPAQDAHGPVPAMEV